jgi:hypothetical protein
MPKFWNIVKANAEIDSAHTEANKSLATAKISTLKVDGKDVAAADAPLAVKIAAIASVSASGEKTQDVSELIASNGQIAAQVEDLNGKLTVANATVSAQSQKIVALESEVATQAASVQTLTAEATTTRNLLEASNKEAARATAQFNAVNAEISGYALKANCLELVGADGKAFAADASEAAKVEAANKISVGDKMKAIFGAVNAAVQKTGVSFAATPAPAPAVAQKEEAKGRARFSASVKVAGLQS